MLPPPEECQRRIQYFDSKYPNSTFDDFWRYKLEVERSGGSILDDSHLDDTVTLLDEKLLSHPPWVLEKTGIPEHSTIREILRKVEPLYEKIRHHCLGQGEMKRIRDELTEIYSGLCGITHARPGLSDPDERGEFYVVGRSKVLMFIWGQTPGFDEKVRSRLGEAGLRSSCPWIEKNRWKPSEFCRVLEQLDQGVVAWNEKYKEEGKTLESLSPNRPVGRIIDIIYWI